MDVVPLILKQVGGVGVVHEVVGGAFAEGGVLGEGVL
jgi:hypothetical protein